MASKIDLKAFEHHKKIKSIKGFNCELSLVEYTNEITKTLCYIVYDNQRAVASSGNLEDMNTIFDDMVRRKKL